MFPTGIIKRNSLTAYKLLQHFNCGEIIHARHGDYLLIGKRRFEHFVSFLRLNFLDFKREVLCSYAEAINIMGAQKHFHAFSIETL